MNESRVTLSRVIRMKIIKLNQQVQCTLTLQSFTCLAFCEYKFQIKMSETHNDITVNVKICLCAVSVENEFNWRI